MADLALLVAQLSAQQDLQANRDVLTAEVAPAKTAIAAQPRPLAVAIAPATPSYPSFSLPLLKQLYQTLALAASQTSWADTRTTVAQVNAPFPTQPPELTPPSLQQLLQGISRDRPGQTLPELSPPSRQPTPLQSASQLSRLQALRSPVEALPRFVGPRPHSGNQLYQQRRAALLQGQLYTRLSPDSFHSQWANASEQPVYSQWRQLLAQEASAMAAGQGQNRLTVVVGDSLSLWLPPEWLPTDQFWLNQGISGDTTAGILQRLSAFDQTRPTTIHLMAGINDLKNGATNSEVLSNLQQIVQKLRQTHPQAHIIVHSILPTRLASLPSDRIAALNQQIDTMTAQAGADFLDLQPSFKDEQGILRRELTTDGLHLSPQGYRLWQVALAAL
ncbi:MAG: lysophospholipase [Leptolyngbyaceae cyanobacterium SL_1_1]|nr:lysophospholipase [Leptolyngbyaceae cyanobacterium RM1_1_2]NJO09940.1 lysophospholipase [Leptolyngbyaceae cyanobacterium SL_1_1]